MLSAVSEAWHENCITDHVAERKPKGTSMNAAIDPMIQVNPLFMRVDLLIEVSKLELAIASIRRQKVAGEVESLVAPLASRVARINEALGRLSA